jgi:hypothetical protein
MRIGSVIAVVTQDAYGQTAQRVKGLRHRGIGSESASSERVFLLQIRILNLTPHVESTVRRSYARQEMRQPERSSL